LEYKRLTELQKCNSLLRQAEFQLNLEYVVLFFAAFFKVFWPEGLREFPCFFSNRKIQLEAFAAFE
tara:strand:- start:1673 stop:1870 length:198 start_codon:yes stop_codon:yes gene_type:complete